MSRTRRHPSVSVVIPTHQGERFLRQTLRSISSQTVPISQLVVSDDESTDSTRQIVHELEEVAKFEIVLVAHAQSGVTANYLNGLSHATADIVFVSDQDDVWREDKVEKALASFESPEVQLACHDSELVDADLNPIGLTLRGGQGKSRTLSEEINAGNDAQNFTRFLRGGLPMLAHTLAFRRSLAPDLLDKPPAIDNWWFEEWVSSIAAMRGRIAFLAEALVLYRQHAGQTSGGYSRRSGKRTTDRARWNSRSSRQQSRLEKMKYCLEFLEQRSPETLFKREILEDYIDFLQTRGRVVQRGIGVSPVSDCCRLLLSGRYRRYSQGLRSFLLDAVSMARPRSS